MRLVKTKGYNRGRSLRTDLNSLLKNTTNIEEDVFLRLSRKDLFELKRILSITNNLLTYEITLLSAKWLKRTFKLSKSIFKELVDDIKSTKPNTNGFDIVIDRSNCRIVAEVKCILPINNGDAFGAAQIDGILNDAVKLHKGKKDVKDTTTYLKFIFLAKIPNKTDKAIATLLKPWNMNKSTKNQARKQRHTIKEKLIVVNKSTPRLTYTTDKIFIVEI